MAEKNEYDREIRTDAVDFSFGEIANLHRDEEIVIAPEYQRLFRWSNEQRSRLIESIVLELPIPPIFLVEDENGILELIDGLQRISSVIQFLDHAAIDQEQLILSGCDIIRDLNDKTLDDLPLSVRLRIKRTPIRAIIIRKSGDQHIKYELFKRLNTGGSLLSAQEIRNCSSRMIEGGEEFYSVIQEMASYDNFVAAIGRLPEQQKEQKGDEELVLRFFAVNFFRHGYHGNVREWLDDYMQGILFRNIEFNFDEMRDLFLGAFDFLADNFGADAFARYRDRVAQGRLAPAYFEAVAGGLSNLTGLLNEVDGNQLREKLIDAIEDDDFIASTGPGANTIEKLDRRIAIVEEHFRELI